MRTLLVVAALVACALPTTAEAAITFSKTSAALPPPNANGVAIAEVDPAAGADIVATSFAGNGAADHGFVSLLPNDGTGAFPAANRVDVDLGAGTKPTSVVAADLDGDLDRDIAVVL